MPVQAATNPFASAPTFAASKGHAFLSAQDAFGPSLHQEEEMLILTFDIQEGHYLYRDKLTLDPETTPWEFSQEARLVDDPEFGSVYVFDGPGLIEARTKAPQSGTVTWQGCAVAGLCYAPEQLHFGSNNTAVDLAPALPSLMQSATLDSGGRSLADNVDLPTSAFVDETTSTPFDAASDPFGIRDNPTLAVVFLFVAGLGLAFTACVYPMVPIVGAMVARPSAAKYRPSVLTGAYVLGVAVAYGLLGAFVAGFGAFSDVMAYLQHPWVLGVFALCFVIGGLLMLGAFSLPSFGVGIKRRFDAIQARADAKMGAPLGSFLAGGLSALVVSPCVSAPLAAALLAVSATQSVGLGFVLLFAMGLGLSMPLFAFGLGIRLAKSGAWLAIMPQIAGHLLIALGIYLIARFVESPLILGILGVWALHFALALWGFGRGWRAVALALSVLGVGQLTGALMGHTDYLAPLKIPSAVMHSADQPTHTPAYIASLDELDAIDDAAPILLKVHADWCVECRLQERTLFANPHPVLDKVRLVTFDATEMNASARALFERYNLVGPPALVLLHGDTADVHMGHLEETDLVNWLAPL